MIAKQSGNEPGKKYGAWATKRQNAPGVAAAEEAGGAEDEGGDYVEKERRGGRPISRPNP